MIDNFLNKDEKINDMCKNLKRKFDKYWTQYSVMLVFGAILDSIIKLSMSEFFTRRLRVYKILFVKTKLYKLFEQYSNTNNVSSS